MRRRTPPLTPADLAALNSDLEQIKNTRPAEPVVEPEPKRKEKRQPDLPITATERTLVAVMASQRMSLEEIAGILGARMGRPVSVDMLRKHFQHEIDNASAILRLKASTRLAQAVQEGQAWAVREALRSKQSEAAPLAPMSGEPQKRQWRPKGQQKRSERKRSNALGRDKVPPLRARASPKNSHTSPKVLHRRKRIAEALQYREQGYSYTQIAGQMKISVGVAHNMVVEGMNALIAEPAAAVLKMELARLDSLLSAHYQNAFEYGDMASSYLCLKIMDQKSRLLGLYPERDKPQTLIAVAGGGEPQRPPILVEFVVPSGKGEPERPLHGWDAPPAQRLLPAPREKPLQPLDGEILRPKPGKGDGTGWMG